MTWTLLTGPGPVGLLKKSHGSRGEMKINTTHVTAGVCVLGLDYGILDQAMKDHENLDHVIDYLIIKDFLTTMDHTCRRGYKIMTDEIRYL